MPCVVHCESDAHNVNQSVHSLSSISFDHGGNLPIDQQTVIPNDTQTLIIPDDPKTTIACTSSTITPNCDNNLTTHQPASNLLISKDDKKESKIPAFDHTKLIAAIRKRKHRTISKVRKTVAQRLAEKLHAVQPPVSDMETSTSQSIHRSVATAMRQDHFDAMQQRLPVKISSTIASDAPECSTAPCNTHTDASKFLQQNCAGHHVWLNPAYKDLDACLKHYLHCKSKDPVNTSAAVLVPKHPTAEWWPKIKGMQLIAEYPKGTYLYEYASASLPASSIPVAMQVWYDPAKTSSSTVLASAHSTKMPVMTFLGNVAGITTPVHVQPADVHIAVDTYASACFVSLAYLKQHGIAYQATPPSDVLLGDNTKLSILGTCTLKVHIQAYQDKVQFWVLDLKDGLTVILGDSWLDAKKAHLNYSKRLVTLKKGKRQITLSPINQNAVPTVPLTEYPLLSAMQFARKAKKSGYYHLCSIQSIKSDTLAEPNEFHDSITQKYPEVFQELPDGLPPESHGIHDIILEPGTRPTFGPMYRMSPAEHLEAERQVKIYMDKGWIQPSSSPWSSPVLFAPKKDGGLRMCIDYRVLNKLTVKNRYPLPRIDDMLDKLHGAKYFSAIDLQQGYHQISMADRAIPYTAFRTSSGHYEFKVMTFGLTNAPATFQNAMNTMFHPYINNFCLVYLDDILIYSKTAEEHHQHLQLVFDLLQQHQYRAKLSKCTFGVAELKYLGFVVGQNGLKVDQDKTKVIDQWPTPTNLHELRSFLGLCNYFRKFVQGYSTLVLPLTNLTRATAPWVWSADCVDAFQRVKQAMTSAPVLALPDFTKTFTVQCDASGYAIGSVLMQEGHPIAFESRKMNAAEQNYPVTEQELLSVIHSMTVWRCYLEGSESIVVTDHNPLTFFQTQPNLSRRQVRWSEYLQRFHYTWVYIPGKINVADPLSRNPTYLPKLQTQVLNVLTRKQNSANTEQLPQTQRQAKRARHNQQQTAPINVADAQPTFHTQLMQKLKGLYIQDNWFAVESNITKHALVQRHGLWWKDNTLVIPDANGVRKECFKELHSYPYSGHVGIRKTHFHMSRLFWWPGMRADLKQWVLSCHDCQLNKASTHAPYGLLKPLPIPGRRWESVSMDLIVALPKTDRGNDTIVQFVCRLTKMVHIVPCKTPVTTVTMAEMYMEHVYKHHGLAKQFISDRGSQFVAGFWQEIWRLLGTKVSLSTAYHPQTDGQTERYNRVLEEMLRHYIAPTLNDWDKHLCLAEFAINNSWQASIQTTPFFLNCGQHPLTPASIDVDSSMPAAQDFIETMTENLNRAKMCMRQAQHRDAHYANKSRKDISFAIGSQVSISTKNFTFKNPVSCKKMTPRFMGPFEVLEQLNPVTYRLKLPDSMKIHDVFHVSLLKPYRWDGDKQPPPPQELDDGSLQFEVEQILAHKEDKTGKPTKYLLKWKGYDSHENLWEPPSNLNCSRLLTEYWKKPNKVS
jgi:Reverse transcriptase (RNA-dependent DNA polymerase)/RNase H-like domain found in reverse transcriptase/Integrase zinc binding domain/Chromo (CHRromatin Organisation MOdifier) domain